MNFCGEILEVMGKWRYSKKGLAANFYHGLDKKWNEMFNCQTEK